MDSIARHLDDFFDVILTPSAILDADGVVLKANEAFRTLVGSSSAEGRSLLDLVRPEDRAAVDRELGILRGGRARVGFFEARLGAPSSERWISVHVTSIPDAADRVVGCVLQAQDATERHDAVSLGALHETMFRTLVEQGPGVVYLHEVSRAPTWITYVSPQIETMLGYASSAWTQDPRFWETILHPDDRAWLPAADEAAIREGRDLDVEYRFHHRDGHVVWVQDRSTVIRDDEGTPVARQGLMVDVTARREADERLAEAEARYRSLVESSPGVVYLNDPTETPPRQLYVGPQIEQMLGYPPEDFIGDPDLWSELVHPDDRARVMARTNEAIAANEDLEMELRMVRRDGGVRWIHDSTKVVRDSNGGALVRQGIAIDVTDVRETHARFVEAEARYRSLVERLPIATYVDEGFHPLVTRYMSPEIERLTGYSVEEWSRDNDMWERVILDEDRPRVLEQWGRVVSGDVDSWAIDYRIVRKDGGVLWIRDLAEIRYSDGRPIVEGVYVDITDRKLVEQELAELNEELAAVHRARGEFFTTASHEFRTPLTAILGFLDILDRDWDRLPDRERREHVTTIQRQAHRLTRLVRDFLAIVEMDQGLLSVEPEVVELRVATEGAIRQLDIPPSEVRLSVSGRPTVLGDRGRVEQIIVNLLANAIRYGRPPVRIDLHNGGPIVEVRVSDEGPGVPEDLAPRLFERFALSGETERRIQQGFGLGLSVARDLARAQGGDLRYEPDGGGATFVLTLPAAEA